MRRAAKTPQQLRHRRSEWLDYASHIAKNFAMPETAVATVDQQSCVMAENNAVNGDMPGLTQNDDPDPLD